MYYFDTLPKIITPDQNGYPILMTNLLARSAIVQELLNNPMQFYEYAIQEGDTPEIVAEKYYGDPFRYWIVLFSNQILDPVWDWPMSYASLLEYIDSKYATEAADAGKTPYEYTNSTVYEYKKILTTTDTYTETVTVNEVSISEDDYNSLIESSTIYNIPGGTSCIVVITKKIITLYDYENDLNDSRRQIKLLNSNYAGEIESQLNVLMEVK
jgi:hypothetical protein